MDQGFLVSRFPASRLSPAVLAKTPRRPHAGRGIPRTRDSRRPVLTAKRKGRVEAPVHRPGFDAPRSGQLEMPVLIRASTSVNARWTPRT